MHFHEQAQCPKCYHRREASTPIPNIMWLAALCEWCGGLGLIGLNDGHACRACRAAWLADRYQQRRLQATEQGEAHADT